MSPAVALWCAVVLAAIAVGCLLAWTTRAVAEELRRSDDDPVDLGNDVDLTYRLDDWQTWRDTASPTTPRGGWDALPEWERQLLDPDYKPRGTA